MDRYSFCAQSIWLKLKKPETSWRISSEIEGLIVIQIYPNDSWILSNELDEIIRRSDDKGI